MFVDVSEMCEGKVNDSVKTYEKEAVPLKRNLPK